MSTGEGAEFVKSIQFKLCTQTIPTQPQHTCKPSQPQPDYAVKRIADSSPPPPLPHTQSHTQPVRPETAHRVEGARVVGHPALEVGVHLRRPVLVVQSLADGAPVGQPPVQPQAGGPGEEGVVQLAVIAHALHESRQLLRGREVVHVDVGAGHGHFGIVGAAADDGDLLPVQRVPVLLRHVVTAVAVLKGQHKFVAPQSPLAVRVVLLASQSAAGAVSIHRQQPLQCRNATVALCGVDAAAGRPEDHAVVTTEGIRDCVTMAQGVWQPVPELHVRLVRQRLVGLHNTRTTATLLARNALNEHIRHNV